MNRKPPIRRRNKDGLLYTVGKPIVVPPHRSSVTIQEKDTINVALIGCGGTGSQVLTGLGQIHASLRAMNAQDGCRCQGLRVIVYDPDVVTSFNVGRQLFYESDVGLNKAECLVGRVNMAYGTKWRAEPRDFRKAEGYYSAFKPHVVITCVDTASARRDLHEILWDPESSRYDQTDYWLDCGNLATVGQVTLGQPGRSAEEAWPRNREFDPERMLWKGQRKQQVSGPDNFNTMYFEKKYSVRLPCVTELFPELLDENFDETNEPSCSMVDALRKQSLFVNRTVSAYALDLLWELIREGKVDNQGCYFNLRSRIANPIPLKVWPVQAKRGVAPADKRLTANRSVTEANRSVKPDGPGAVNEATGKEATGKEATGGEARS